ncbi:hypothetical protein M409DRAFT_21305 [Zasmidium cellare ATCC 36951]|uniref:Uncharacterized protein n=1 Tax=Zasmidium cellare ATCC 36951 TaxID=1080233 RepID=A0A6A6CN29_ZASCE|nr:uncharacterized protein M409DRAFT_21305 [Zasmidium cellare ATCC 36951]KAF2168554.1 hypothetical protein M409DRAFT_21305 [Zasmidium cellare ATCC 36951]
MVADHADLYVQDFDNELQWTASPISDFIELPMKITSNRAITDIPEVEYSDASEVNQPAERLFLDVTPQSAVFGQPPSISPTGNITVARVDGGQLHPFVLRFIFIFTKAIIDYTSESIEEARSDLEKEEKKALGRCYFRSEVFYDGFEVVRGWNTRIGKQSEWEAVENPF